MTAIPIICMGLCALPAMRLYSLLGAGRALFLSLALTVLGGTLRALTWDIPLMYALTMAAGVGAGLAGAMFPAIVRRLPAGVRARATGFCSLGVNGGAGFTAAFAVPFARAAGGWRGAFLALGFAGIWSMAAWLIFTRRELAPPDMRRQVGLPRGDFRWPCSSAWSLASRRYASSVSMRGWPPPMWSGRGPQTGQAGWLQRSILPRCHRRFW